MWRYRNIPDATRKNKCEKVARFWISDIEARTQLNWDVQGRIELSKQYALGSARELLLQCVQKCGQDWEAVKKAFLAIYPEPREYADLSQELHKAARQKGENIRDFSIRLNNITSNMIRHRPEHRECLTETTALKVLATFPPPFGLTLAPEKKKDYVIILQKGYEWVAKHPETKLSDADIEKEAKTVGLHAVNIEHPTPYSAPLHIPRGHLRRHGASQRFVVLPVTPKVILRENAPRTKKITGKFRELRDDQMLKFKTTEIRNQKNARPGIDWFRKLMEEHARKLRQRNSKPALAMQLATWATPLQQ